MARSDDVVKVLEESNKRAIGYQNRAWIKENAMDMNIRVYAQDCNVELYHIEEKSTKNGVMIIQNGKKVEFKSEFNPKEEALLLVKFEDINYIFQYFPKN